MVLTRLENINFDMYLVDALVKYSATNCRFEILVPRLMHSKIDKRLAILMAIIHTCKNAQVLTNVQVCSQDVHKLCLHSGP